MGKDFQIAVITVVRNDADGLKRTIESVSNQTYPYVAHVIIDGASTDSETPAILERHSSRLAYCVSEPDEGIYDAMNKGINMAPSDAYLVFLNAGDTFYDTGTLEMVIGCITGEVDAFYGDIYLKHKDNESILHVAKAFDKSGLQRFGTGVLCHQAFFIKKSIAPLYNTQYKYKAELDWYFDIIEKNPSLKTQHIRTPIVIYETGGLGYQHFIKNRLEWLKVITNRYGWEVVAEHDLILYLLKNAQYRYRWLVHVPLKTECYRLINFICNTIIKVTPSLRK